MSKFLTSAHSINQATVYVSGPSSPRRRMIPAALVRENKSATFSTATRTLLFFAAAAVATAVTSEGAAAKELPQSSSNILPFPSLRLVENVLLTTAEDSFGGYAKGFEAAARWSGERLEGSQEGNPRHGPHLACAGHTRGREAISRLRVFLSPQEVRPVVHSSEHGATCFIVTALPSEAREIAANSDGFGVDSIAPFPSDLKIAPGILEHDITTTAADDGHRHDSDYQPAVAAAAPGTAAARTPRLGVTHGVSMRSSNAEGLTMVLSPGTLPAHVPGASEYIGELLGDLTSKSIDLRAGSVWSDPRVANGEHLATREGAARGRDWTLAAVLVHGLSRAGKTTPGDVCSWDRISLHHAGDDLLLVSGMNTSSIFYDLYVQVHFFCQNCPFNLLWVRTYIHTYLVVFLFLLSRDGPDQSFQFA